MEKSKLELYVRAVDHALENDAEPFRSLLCHGLKLLHLSDLEAADLLGVSRPSITRWRAARVHPNAETRRAVLVALRARTIVGYGMLAMYR
jgi:hypothetical protein